ncbi:MAG TPA: hypothetical protein VFO28_00780 [Burkholderiaceae bacterium]|nr:hypothetical protein [Burkholderiaceae bacterium]
MRVNPMAHRGARRIACALLWAAAAAGAVAADKAVPNKAAPHTLVTELEQRLARSNVDAVNAHLVAHWSSAMVPLHQQTAACQGAALNLTVRLSRGRHAVAAGAHGDALRSAAGRCLADVMALLTMVEVPRLCTSMASWGPATAARELRRRIAAIDADALLRDSARGQACRAAYHHELHHTRVVVKRVVPPAKAAASAPAAARPASS